MQNSVKYTFKGKGDKVYNDIEFSPETVFDITSSSYSIVISPKSKFWRFGLRFGISKDAKFDDQRYNNKELKHVEIAAGNQVGMEWRNPNKLFLQEYFIHGSGGVLNDCSTYTSLTDINVELDRINESWVLVTCKSEGCPTFSVELPIKDHKFFKLFAWADSLEFEMEVSLTKTMRIKLNQIKALSGQEVEIEVKDLMVFFGRNNCGKSSIILGASHHFMNTGNFVMDYIGPNRFETADQIDPKLKGKSELREQNRKARNNYSQATENVPIDPVFEFWLQDDDTRLKISNWVAQNFEELKISRREIDEFSSMPEVTIAGRNPRFQGTGARMVLGIVVQLFCPDVKFLCIDEPELSLEPRAQKVLFSLVKKAVLGEDGVPKKQILIATHSHVFLDKDVPTNNYKVTKIEEKIRIEQIQDESQLQGEVYNLLGNSPSDLFFPGNIVVVEGRSDRDFLFGVYSLLKSKKIISERKVVFHFVEGIEKAKLGAIAVDEMLKTQSYISVYRDKICGLFDAPNNKSAIKVINEVIHYFKDDGTRFVTLEKDAIEYYYPLQIVREYLSIPELSLDDFTKGTKKYLEQTKADKTSHSGDYFGVRIDKVSLSRDIIDLLHKNADLSLVDEAIVKLLKKADELSY